MKWSLIFGNGIFLLMTKNQCKAVYSYKSNDDIQSRLSLRKGRELMVKTRLNTLNQNWLIQFFQWGLTTGTIFTGGGRRHWSKVFHFYFGWWFWFEMIDGTNRYYTPTSVLNEWRTRIWLLRTTSLPVCSYRHTHTHTQEVNSHQRLMTTNVSKNRWSNENAVRDGR